MTDTEKIIQVARSISISFGNSANGQTVYANGSNVTTEIRTPEVDKNVSTVAAIPEVREAMVTLQRRAGKNGDVVAEGRDIGTVVFPEADVKVFLTADPAARAHRRAVQRQGGDAATGNDAQVDAKSEEKILEGYCSHYCPASRTRQKRCTQPQVFSPGKWIRKQFF